MGPSSSPGVRLRDAVRAMVVAQGTFNDPRRPCGAKISASHAYALLELSRAPQGMTVSDLAQRLIIDRTNVSRLTERMARVGELVRKEHPTDARARVLCLTPRGRDVAQGVHRSSARHFERLVQALGPEAEVVIGALHRLCAVMNPTEEQP